MNYAKVFFFFFLCTISQCLAFSLTEPLKIDKKDLKELSMFPKNFVKAGDKTYYVASTTTVNWYEANEFCAQHGMKSASINNKQENDQIISYIEENGFTDNKYWTSGNDLGTTGTWVWMSTGDEFTYTNWDTNQPDHHDWGNGNVEHCVQFVKYSSTSWKWNDERCNAVFNVICESYTKE